MNITMKCGIPKRPVQAKLSNLADNLRQINLIQLLVQFRALHSMRRVTHYAGTRNWQFGRISGITRRKVHERKINNTGQRFAIDARDDLNIYPHGIRRLEGIKSLITN